MKSLDELRIEIDEINDVIYEAFIKRMEIVKNVAIYKAENNLPITNSQREIEIINKYENKTLNQDIKGEVGELFKKIISLSKNYEHLLMENSSERNEKNHNTLDTICFQGIPGSYSEEALNLYFGENSKNINVPTFHEVFEKIKDDNAYYGILPIDNSSTGGINDVYDLLLKYNFYINGEVLVKIDHNLIGIEGSNLENIKEVFSHAQGFYQCKDFLNEYPNWKHHHLLNTAISVKHVKDSNNVSYAAIGSKNAAKLYGLKIIKDNINFNSQNYTRFIVISKNLNFNENSNKISIIFSLSHKSGTLYNVLSHFYNNNLNLVKLESRPDIENPWEYIFYLDFIGNLNDPSVKNVLENIKNECTLFKMLGNYVGE